MVENCISLNKTKKEKASEYRLQNVQEVALMILNTNQRLQ